MPWFPKQQVVVPIDFSNTSLAALEVARELVDDVSHLHAIHVLPGLTATEPGLLWNVLDEAAARDAAQEELAKRLTEKDCAGANVAVAFGDPADEIVEFAQSLGAGLIVMPSHGRTGLARLLIGSIAERVTRHAHCPVLIIRS